MSMFNFTDCQCNGHSVCSNSTGKTEVCVECKNMTEGKALQGKLCESSHLISVNFDFGIVCFCL